MGSSGRSEKKAQKAQFSCHMVLVSGPSAAAPLKANSNEPVTALKAPCRLPVCPAPAPESCSSGRVKTGRTGSLAQLPGLEPPASIFFLSASNEASSMQIGAEGVGSPDRYATASLTIRSTVPGQWVEAQRWKGLFQKGAGRGLRWHMQTKGSPREV